MNFVKRKVNLTQQYNSKWGFKGNKIELNNSELDEIIYFVRFGAIAEMHNGYYILEISFHVANKIEAVLPQATTKREASKVSILFMFFQDTQERGRQSGQISDEFSLAMSKDEESDSVEKIGINSKFDSDRLCKKNG